MTSNYVFIESWTLIHHKLGKHAAKKFWASIRKGLIPVIDIMEADLERAWQILTHYSDQDLSLVDCTSFALIDRFGTEMAFSFDMHFSLFKNRNNQYLKAFPES